MRLARVSSALLFVAAVGCTSDNDGPTGAPKLQQVAYYETKDVAVSGELGASASKYVKANDLLTSPGDDWQVRDARAGQNSMQHVRMHQTHNGVRVWGGDVVVHTNGSKFSYVTGNRVTDLVGFDTRAKVSDSTALATAKAEYALSSKDPNLQNIPIGVDPKYEIRSINSSLPASRRKGSSPPPRRIASPSAAGSTSISSACRRRRRRWMSS